MLGSAIRVEGRGRVRGWSAWTCLALAIACGACGRTEENSHGNGSGGTGASSGGSGGSAQTTAGTSSNQPSGGAPDDVEPCPPPSYAALRRLSAFELTNTLRDLFGVNVDGVPADPSELPEIPADDLIGPAVRDYHQRAFTLAKNATRDESSTRAVTGCATALSDDACRDQFIENFLTRVFRRPTEQRDSVEFRDVFARGVQLGGSFSSGVRAVLEVALNSPEFLYRVEFGGQGAGLNAPPRPASHELAVRLSYFLTGSAPDEQLASAAARGELESPANIAAEARRLLALPRAHEAVRHFYEELANYSKPVWRDSVPELTPRILELLPLETARFIDEVTFNGPGTYEALLTAPYTFVNRELALFYGFPDASGLTEGSDDLVKINVTPPQRAGLLTQGSVLTVGSQRDNSRPVVRGQLLLRAFLCAPTDLPPPDASPPATGEPTADATTRQKYEFATSGPTCGACHDRLNPAGFAFEHYDAAGRWRDSENGSPIDATGELPFADLDGKFDGALDLAQRLAKSSVARSCFVSKWSTLAYGRAPDASDTCSAQAVATRFERSNGNVLDLLVAIAESESFRAGLPTRATP